MKINIFGFTCEVYIYKTSSDIDSQILKVYDDAVKFKAYYSPLIAAIKKHRYLTNSYLVDSKLYCEELIIKSGRKV